MLVKITDRLLIDVSSSEIVYIDSDGNNRTVKITKPEANILAFLNENRNDVFSKDELVNIGWRGRVTGANSLNVAIYNLRKYLSVDEYILLENIPRTGYKLNVIAQTDSSRDDIVQEIEATDTCHELTSEDKSNKIIINGKYIFLKLVNIKLMKYLMLLLVSLLLLQFILTICLNLVWVECVSNANGKICYSSNYLGKRGEIEIPEGFSVISNHNFSNINE